MTTLKQKPPPVSTGGEPPPPVELSSDLREVSHTPAYAFLDELLQTGQLSETQVQVYKNKYARLHEVVLQTYESEKALLSRAKALNSDLQTVRSKLERKSIDQAEQQSQIQLLKQDLEKESMELQHEQEHASMLKYEIDELNRSKQEVADDLDNEKRKNHDMMGPTVRKINQQITDLEDDIKRQHDAFDRETAEKQTFQKRVAEIKESIDNLEKAKARKRQDLSKAKAGPERVRIQTEVVSRAAQNFEGQAKALTIELKEIDTEREEVMKERDEIQKQWVLLGYALENAQAAIDKQQREIEYIARQYQTEQEKTNQLEEKRVLMQFALTSKKERLRGQSDMLTNYTKEVEHYKRRYEKLRRKLETLTDAITPLQQQYKEAVGRHTEMKSEAKKQKKVLTELRQDVDVFISQYLREEQREEEVDEALKDSLDAARQKEAAIQEMEGQEQSLQREIRELSAQRELMARETSKAASAYRDTKEELKVKDLIIMDLTKKSHELSNRLNNCRKLYDVIKNQRNRYANLTQGSSQALTEMKEKIKIITNEVDILRNESLSKDRSLAEEARVLQTAQYTRDALRLELNKNQQLLRERKSEANRQMLDIQKLNSIISQAEKEMMRLRTKYQRAVEDRNRTGIQLIDRNDELCILYEKANILQGILQQGEEQIQKREQHVAEAATEIQDLTWQIEVARKQVPSLDQQKIKAKKFEELERQLKEEKLHVQYLSQQLEKPNPELNPTRYRKLPGEDPDADQLGAKIQVLQERLNDKKEHLLEKELVLEEVSALSNKLRTQAAEGHTMTLELAKKINDYQSRIKTVTRKMMAVVSELSMYQATAIKLEQEKHDRESEVASARERLEQGLPPTEVAEHEWYRLERERIRRQESLLRRNQDAADDQAMLPGVTRTTAEPRPNAYIPDQIGIPKPYGGNAPFKPTQLGANLRHIRKPQPVEIVI